MKAEFVTPEYGPLRGLRVMVSGIALAGPFAARMMADYGAEVIKIETPKAGDSSRLGTRTEHGVVPKWISLNRNVMSVELNLNFDKYPEAKQVFVDLCAQCDVWINSIPGIAKHGATDELALESNPKLIINHITGYGLAKSGGDKDYFGRVCLDPVGQAFSGLAALQGMPDGPFLAANPMINDSMTGVLSVVGILSAYYNMLRTGKGQVVDTSMFESAAYFMTSYWCSQLNADGNYVRAGVVNPTYYPFGYYEAGDGEWVTVGVFGTNMWGKFAALMGVNVEEFSYSDTCVKSTSKPETVAAMDVIWKEWLSKHSAAEAEAELSKAGIASSVLMKADAAFVHPHWNARNDFIKLKDETTGDLLDDFAAAPKFLGSPVDYSKYHGAPILGQHTDLVMGKILGYDDAKIADLKEKGIIAASLITK